MTATPLLNGRVQVEFDEQDSNPPDLAAAWASSRASVLERIAKPKPVGLPPQVGRFYRTADSALVWTSKVDRDRDALCLVLALPDDGGSSRYEVGQSVWLFESERVSTKANDPVMLRGRWLVDELPWRITPLLNVAVEAQDDSFAWLRDPEFEQRVEPSPGIWQTWNGSVVAVFRQGDIHWSAAILTGGVPESRKRGDDGLAIGQSYLLHNDGSLKISATSVRKSGWSKAGFELLDHILVRSGLSLRRPLHIVDDRGRQITLRGQVLAAAGALAR